MDGTKFDGLTKALAEGRSRRDVVKKLAGGGIAAALAVVGLGAVDVEHAEAATCRGRCRRRFTGAQRRRCMRRCKRTENNTNNGVTINNGDINLLGNNISLTTISQTCDGSKVTAALCQSGFCDVNDNTCKSCPTNRVCGEDDDLVGKVCCANGFVCLDLGCVVP